MNTDYYSIKYGAYYVLYNGLDSIVAEKHEGMPAEWKKDAPDTIREKFDNAPHQLTKGAKRYY